MKNLSEGIRIALALSISAGLCTSIGGLIAVFSKKDDTKFLSIALGFSAGVMIAVSLVGLFPEAVEYMSIEKGNYSKIIAVAFMVVGILMAVLLDNFIPSPDKLKITKNNKNKSSAQMIRLGIVTAIALTLHNFPEGITTFMSGLTDLSIGIPIAISIALHNIPEGVAIALPFYYGTNSKGKGFLLATLSGLTEPLGAVIAYLFLAPFISDYILGIVFAIVSGIMIYIAFAELVPASENYKRPRAAASGIVGGTILMIFILVIFKH